MMPEAVERHLYPLDAVVADRPCLFAEPFRRHTGGTAFAGRLSELLP